MQFKFIAKTNAVFVEGSEVELVTGLTEWNPFDTIENGFGEFYGNTNTEGGLCMMGGEICNYDEFDIYYNDIRVNEMTFADIQNNNKQK